MDVALGPLKSNLIKSTQQTVTHRPTLTLGVYPRVLHRKRSAIFITQARVTGPTLLMPRKHATGVYKTYNDLGVSISQIYFYPFKANRWSVMSTYPGIPGYGL